MSPINRIVYYENSRHGETIKFRNTRTLQLVVPLYISTDITIQSTYESFALIVFRCTSQFCIAVSFVCLRCNFVNKNVARDEEMPHPSEKIKHSDSRTKSVQMLMRGWSVTNDTSWCKAVLREKITFFHVTFLRISSSKF